MGKNERRDAVSNKEKVVLSSHLSLESLEKKIGTRVIVNTLTGQRLKVSRETMKILSVFQTPCTFIDAARYLGVKGQGSRKQLRSLVSSLIESSFLIDASDVVACEQHNMRTITDTNPFVCPRILFAHCPTANATEIERGAIVITGVCNDQATTGCPGARYGPERLREVSTRFITYDRDIFTLANRGWYDADIEKVILKGVPFVDMGNVANHLSENPCELYNRCYRAALAIYQKMALPVFIGGDHSISAPLIRACKKVYGDLVLVHFDAHTDLGEWDSSTTHHHGNVMSRVLHENPDLEIYQIGIRGFAGTPLLDSRCHVIQQRKIDTQLSAVLSQSIPHGRTCYISFDVDVIDPCFAPGTGTPVPMGMSPSTLLYLFESIAKQNHIVGIDLVELCPDLDRNDMTTSLVFHLLMCLLGWVYES